MPTPSVKSVGAVAEKWARRVSGASMDYQAGAESAGERWASGAKAANTTYTQAVTAAANAGRYSRGVEKAGAGRFVKGVRDKGAVRYGPGAAAAQSDFSGAIAPVLEVISRTDLPPRGPRGSDGNYQRVVKIGQALRAFATKS